MRKILVAMWALAAVACSDRQVVVEPLTTNSDISIRAIHAISDSDVWASGTESTVLRSQNGGESWIDIKVVDSLNLDFRSLWVFDAQSAIVVAVDNPALIYRTDDGGNSWQEVYRKNEQGMFLNSISFKDSQNGVIIGDPIDGRFFTLHSSDGGRSWQEVGGAEGIAGEGCFAASNSCITYLPNGEMMFVTGMKRSAVYRTHDTTFDWSRTIANIKCDSLKGTDGIYAITMLDNKNGFVGGGNYRSVEQNDAVIGITTDGGESWRNTQTNPHGFVSSIKAFSNDNNSLIAVGSHGVSVSFDRGENWKIVDVTQGYHAASSPDGDYIYVAGSNGRVAKIYIM